MHTYTFIELPKVIKTLFSDNIDADRCSIMGHSMGGCGSLLLAAKNPISFKSFSAIAPRCSPSNSESNWGKHAYDIYFGSD